ncbi:MAG: hypothetical protein V4525_15395 [Pseudomonadota bacterium]
MKSLIETFCPISKFCKEVEPKWKNAFLNAGKQKQLKEADQSSQKAIYLFNTHRAFKQFLESWHISFTLEKR